jgi:hypothetical protein
MDQREHKPARDRTGETEILLGFLDYHRGVITRKVGGLAEPQRRVSRLPSGWTPLELVKHLTAMERRWLCWGFLAEPMPVPYPDEDAGGRWRVGAAESTEELLAALAAGGVRTAEIAGRTGLATPARTGGRFAEGEPVPTLGWILVYVLQEYARHAGHLDVVCELAGGAVGE